MFLTRTEYDRGVNTFSPEGRLFQVEYAIEATKLGSTGIGIKTPEGIVLAVEKRVNSPLIVPSSIEKIFKVDDHIACAVSGLVADARTLIERARTEAAHHWFVYNEKMSVEDVTKAVSNLALAFGDDDVDSGAMSRPFGAALMFAGIDENGPQLYTHGSQWNIHPLQTRSPLDLASEGAQQALQEVFHSNMTLHEGCKHALSILKQVMEEKLDSTNVELATVSSQYNFHLYNKDEVHNLIQELASS
uniref:Proteasome subunit alpha type n=1 Tax=Opisthorchis viverrini TaxID=6198 RepID=Q208S5_OPIVI|nr:proteasome subunit alpha type 5 [Opisthorchis viverrini]